MKRLITTALVAATLLVGCAKEEGASYRPGNGEVRITSSIATRTLANVWESGDAIGVYMSAAGAAANTYLGANVMYATTQNKLGEFSSTTPLYYPATGRVDLLAYYPYVAGTEQAPFDITSYQVNVVEEDNLGYPINAVVDKGSIDLMKAEASNVSENPDAVKMTFNHKLAYIDLKITPGGGLVADDLKRMVVTLSGTDTQASYDLTKADNENPITLGGAVGDITMFISTDQNAVVVAANAIVIPQSMSNAKLSFTTTAYGTFEAEINTSEFTIGNKYSYNVTISRTAVSISSPTIADWGSDNDTTDDDITATLPQSQ